MGTGFEERGFVSRTLRGALAVCLLVGCNSAPDEVTTTFMTSTTTISVATTERSWADISDLLSVLDYFIIGKFIEAEGRFLGTDVDPVTAELELLEPGAVDVIDDLLATDRGQQGLLCYFFSSYVFFERYWSEEHDLPIGAPDLHKMALNRLNGEIAHLFDTWDKAWNKAYQEASDTPGMSEIEKLEWAALVAASYANLILDEVYCPEGTTFAMTNPSTD